MYKFNGFTETAAKTLNYSIESAQNLGHTYIGCEHILLGLLKEQSGVAFNILSQFYVTEPKYTLNLMSKIGKGSKTRLSIDDLTPRAKRVLEQSIVKSTIATSKNAGTDHILLAILSQSDSLAVTILTDMGVNINMLEEQLKNCNLSDKSEEFINNKQSSSANLNKSLSRYSINLTEKAILGKLDPVIERNSELQRMIQILCRRTKNNPCLIGEPGVGKTAVVEGLAIKIAKNDVPPQLALKQILSLDLTGMIAGTRYRGDFEDRLSTVINEIKSNPNIIIFIDEIHNIIGAGSAEGSTDVANMLKPHLINGDIKIIGATTNNEYRKYISKDIALERRLQPINVNEPTEEQAIKILNGIKSKYEQHHKVIITDNAIKSAVMLSKRYITDRFLPDKAIDLIDEAACRVSLASHSQNNNDLINIEQQKIESLNKSDFETLNNIMSYEKTLNKNLNTTQSNYALTDKCDVAKVLSDWTSIPISDLTNEENLKLQNIENDLKQYVISQDKAVLALSKALKRNRTGIKDPNKPIGSFMFLGPTGVGKSYLCKMLAKIMFSKEDALIRFDMSEFMEKHSVSKLIGSPPGYIGFDEGGQLTEQVKKKPYSVLMFDEIEKAHPDVLNILLQILEDGHLTDSQGRRIDFKNTIIIMTSNIGAKIICNQDNNIGFKEFSKTEKDIKNRVFSQLKKDFKPEFLNRIDDIIMFNRLSETDCCKIVKLMLNDLYKRAENLDIYLSFSEKLINYIAKKGFDPLLGARPLKRTIQNEIEDKLSDEILSSNIKKGDHALIDIYNNTVVIKVESLVNSN